MAELFRMEAESQTQVLTTSLLALERDPAAAAHLEVCMRAAHSLKGAARLVGLETAVDVAHAMEDCFVAAQRGEIALDGKRIDVLLEGIDLLNRLAGPSAAALDDGGRAEAHRFTARLTARPAQGPSEALPSAASQTIEPASVSPSPSTVVNALPPVISTVAAEDRRVLRVTAENFNRLLGLAGESLVESRWLKSYYSSLFHLKRLHQDMSLMVDGLRDRLATGVSDVQVQSACSELRTKLAECRETLTDRLAALETFDSRSTDLAGRLYDEALACRMRPFADGAAGFPMMMRSLARSLGKEVRLDVVGTTTQVDRDMLEALESPLTHLLRNAADHGIEMPIDRLAAGKLTEGVIRLEASHNAGMLQIIIADDGRGVDLERLRETIVARKLTQQAIAETMTDSELLEFLFLPGFSMKTAVTEISGRGVGLDVVRNMVRQVRGTIRITSQAGHGTRFELRLPLTLSVVRTLQVEIGGESYAFPLAQIVRAVRIPRGEIALVEGKPHFRHAGRLIGLISAAQLLGGQTPQQDRDSVSVIVIEESGINYGLIVDRFLDERETVVQPLDSRFGKVADIMAGGLMEDGSPVLIVDIADMVRSVEKLIAGGALAKLPQDSTALPQRARKRVLVVDDSLTVRELERKLLDHAGYLVETAVDGMEGWNVLRSGRFDLVITDVDMPRMGGIELVRLIKQDQNLQSLPVMIVSYKDEEKDRRLGLEAGADYYLPKASFHDETLLQSVMDLIGEPQP